MATVSFLGGVGSIGSSKVLVEQEGWRVLLDLGPSIPARGQLLTPPVRSRPGEALRDQILLGEAPNIPNLYRSEATVGTAVEGGSNGHTSVFVSHAHIDHAGLLGWVDDTVDIWGSPETVRLLDALETGGTPLEGRRTGLRPLLEGEAVQVGPLEVIRWDVDHDIPGASGFEVHTEDGVLAYSGDLRLHGRHPELSERFASRVRGAWVLAIEGTMLTSDTRLPVREETAVDEAFSKILAECPGLILLTLYPRNIERVIAFVERAGAVGREILWPSEMAAFLQAYGLEGIKELDRASLDAVRSDPDRFVVQITMASLTDLLGLPLGSGSVFVHANGEPLGPFVPSWDLLQAWLDHLGLPFRSIGSSGHATADDLQHLVAKIAPEVVFPIHTADPFRLAAPPGTQRIVPSYGRRYPIGPSWTSRSKEETE